MLNRIVILGVGILLFAACTPVIGALPPQETKPAAPQPPPAKRLDFPPADSSKMPRPVRVKFEDLRRRFASEPADLPSVITAAALLFVHGSPADAVAYGQKMLELSDNDAALHHLLGIFYEKAGDTTKAMTEFQQAINLAPEFTPALVRLALLLIDKEPARAKPLLEKAISLDPRDARALCALARCQEAAGDKDAAIDALRRSLALFPPYKEANERIAALLARQGKADEAAAHRKVAETGYEAPYTDFVLFKVLELGMDVPTLITVAQRAAESGKLDRAEEILAQAIEIEGEGTSARSALAEIKYKAGKIDDAISMVKSIISSAPKDPQARARLGDILFRAGRNKEAIEAFTKAAELAPTVGRYQYWIGLINFRDNQLEAALPAFKKASELNPTLVEARVGYAQLASQLKHYDEAAQAYRAAFKDNPDSPLVQNGAAWFFATIPDDAHRNPKEAVRLAELANKATQYGQHEFLDTLAAAYAADGRFDEATTRIKEAIEKVDAAIKAATDDKAKQRLGAMKADYEKRQALYAEKKPWREESK